MNHDLLMKEISNRRCNVFIDGMNMIVALLKIERGLKQSFHPRDVKSNFFDSNNRGEVVSVLARLKDMCYNLFPHQSHVAIYFKPFTNQDGIWNYFLTECFNILVDPNAPNTYHKYEICIVHGSASDPERDDRAVMFNSFYKKNELNLLESGNGMFHNEKKFVVLISNDKFRSRGINNGMDVEIETITEKGSFKHICPCPQEHYDQIMGDIENMKTGFRFHLTLEGEMKVQLVSDAAAIPTGIERVNGEDITYDQESYFTPPPFDSSSFVPESTVYYPPPFTAQEPFPYYASVPFIAPEPISYHVPESTVYYAPVPELMPYCVPESTTYYAPPPFIAPEPMPYFVPCNYPPTGCFYY